MQFLKNGSGGVACVLRAGLMLACALSAAIAVAGCRDRSSGGTGAGASAGGEHVEVHTYVVRAIITALPREGVPTSEFTASHEAIPEFRGPGGERGMDVMDMPFPVGPGVSLDGFAIGDKVELTFTVDFDLERDTPVAYRMTALTKLDAETVLDFTRLREKSPPGEGG